jgi:hypothetical protein
MKVDGRCIFALMFTFTKTDGTSRIHHIFTDKATDAMEHASLSEEEP